MIGKHIACSLLGVALAVILLAGCAGKNNSAKGGDVTPGGNTAAAQQGGAGGGTSNMAQFHESHKYTYQLQRMAMNIGRLEKDGIAPLTPQQAKDVLAVLNPLRAKDKMTQDDAKDALKGLKAALTEQQLTEIGKMKQPERGGRGGQGGPGGQGGSGGPGGQGGGNRPAFDPAAMQNFNPFNPPKDSPMGGERGKARIDDLFKALEDKAAKA